MDQPEHTPMAEAPPASSTRPTPTNPTASTTSRSLGWTTSWVPTDGGTIRVRHATVGIPDTDGPPALPVLFVHGAFVNGHLWDQVADELARHHRVDSPRLHLLVPDLPLGAHHRPFGPGSSFDLPDVVEMLTAVLDGLGVNGAVLVGNDSGGAIGQCFMAAHPDRVLGALLTPTETSDNFPPRAFRFLFPPLRLRALMWSTAHLLRFHTGRRLPFTFGRLVRRRLPADEAHLVMGPLWSSAGARADLRRFLRTIDPEVMRVAEARFTTVTAPVDVAWCTDHRVFPDADADRITNAFPNGRRVADVTDALPLTPLDQPAQVADRLRDLLDRVGRDRRTIG